MTVGPAPDDAAATGFTAEQYFALVDEGLLEPEDRVELLEGVVVSMAPAGSRHTATVYLVAEALTRAVEGRAAVRSQGPLIAGRRSVPEPDVALVPGRTRDYLPVHPKTALLVVEVAESSLGQDRITKAPIYARNGIAEYWIVNLRTNRVEVHRAPSAGRYCERVVVGPGERLEIVALPGASVLVDDLLPGDDEYTP
jgi:Uma2 family endonuclease